MQAAGHILLGSSCYIEYLLQDEQTTQSLSLPQESRIRQLQTMLLGRAFQGWWTRVLRWRREDISLKFCCAVFVFRTVTRFLSIRKTFSQMLFSPIRITNTPLQGSVSNMWTFIPLSACACTCMCGWQQVQLSPPRFLNCPLASAVLSAAASLCFIKPEEEEKARACSCEQRGGRSKSLHWEGKRGWWVQLVVQVSLLPS